MKRNRLMDSEKGQGMTEYVIVVALIAVGAIAAVGLFGDTLRVMFGKAVAQMQGSTYSETDYDDLADLDEVTKSRDLSNFHERD